MYKCLTPTTHNPLPMILEPYIIWENLYKIIDCVTLKCRKGNFFEVYGTWGLSHDRQSCLQARTPSSVAQCQSIPIKIQALFRNTSQLISIDRHRSALGSALGNDQRSPVFSVSPFPNFSNWKLLICSKIKCYTLFNCPTSTVT